MHAGQFIIYTLGLEIQIKVSSTQDFSVCSPVAKGKMVHHLPTASEAYPPGSLGDG